jgi:hypothetical protein
MLPDHPTASSMHLTRILHHQARNPSTTSTRPATRSPHRRRSACYQLTSSDRCWSTPTPYCPS